jgi:hypothetical protein
MQMGWPPLGRYRAGLAVLLLGGAFTAPAGAETAHGRVTFVGTLGEETRPDGALHARFRFRLSESSCGTSDGLWTRTRTGGVWTGWRQVSPAPLASDPAAVALGAGVIDVFALGTDGHIYTMRRSTGTPEWPGWSRVGSQSFSSGPAAVQLVGNRVDIFARGMADNALWTNTWDIASGGWSGWRQLSPLPISSDPAAVRRGANRIDVFARGTDNRMYTMLWDGARWSQWAPIGVETFSSGPTVTAWATNRRDLFARGMDNALWTSAWDGANWSAWHQVSPAPIASDPAAVSVQSNRIEVFARGMDNAMHTISWDGTQWSGWSGLGDERFAGGPAVTSIDSPIDLFARGSARTDRWFHVTSGRMDGTFQHNAPNFRNAYSTLLTALLARSVTGVQIDGSPSCDWTQVQTFALDRAQIGIYP